MAVRLKMRLAEPAGESEARQGLERLSAENADVAALAVEDRRLALIVVRAMAAGKLLDASARATFVDATRRERARMTRFAALSVVGIAVILNFNSFSLAGPRPLVPIVLAVFGVLATSVVGYYYVWWRRYSPGLTCGVFEMPEMKALSRSADPSDRPWSRE